MAIGLFPWLSVWAALQSPTSESHPAQLADPNRQQGEHATAAHAIVSRLASPEFMGRGYLYDGDSLAASFLEAEFRSIGLIAAGGGSYSQEFSMSVNTFPWEPVLRIADGPNLELGKEFIPAPGSPSASVDAQIYRVDPRVMTDEQALAAFLAKDLRGKVIVTEAAWDSRAFTQPAGYAEKIREASAQITLTDSLLFSVARTQLSLPKVQVLRGRLEGIAEDAFVHLEVQSRFESDHRARNVIGIVPGTRHPEKILVFTAHFDHLGAIGPRVYFPGANDNATGVAMMLELARYYASRPQEYSVAFIGFAAEEAGLVGSKFFVDHPRFPLSDIGFLVNLDLFGTGEEGMTAVNATVFPEAFQLLVDTNASRGALPVVQPRGKAANSDHYWFSEAGVPAFFFYLMGRSWTAYHSVQDTDAVPLTRFDAAFDLMVSFGTRVMESAVSDRVKNQAKTAYKSNR